MHSRTKVLILSKIKYNTINKNVSQKFSFYFFSSDIIKYLEFNTFTLFYYNPISESLEFILFTRIKTSSDLHVNHCIWQRERKLSFIHEILALCLRNRTLFTVMLTASHPRDTFTNGSKYWPTRSSRQRVK